MPNQPTSTNQIADLELELFPFADGLGLRMRYTRPGDQGEDVVGPLSVALDRSALKSLEHDALAYGKALSSQLFADAAAFGACTSRMTAAREAGYTMRIRLHLTEPELHTLRWECLVDPLTQQPLGLDARFLLTRYVSAEAYGAIMLRPRSALRVLVVVANPDDLSRFGLAALDPSAELQRLRTAAPDLAVDLLTPQAGESTLNALGRMLRAAPGYDILYLVAHGSFAKQEAKLFLADAQGKTEVCAGSDLVDLLAGLVDEYRPRMVLLASCESAGDGYANALAALGPRIAQAGIPAVLAMQGNVAIATINRMLPVFFRELLHDGVVDRALAHARLDVRGQTDWWMPVLYTRLREGRIWPDQANDPAAPYVEGRRLDAAAPAEAFVGDPIELLVQLCLPNSPGFRDRLPITTESGAEITQDDVHGGEMSLTFPTNADGLPRPAPVRIKIAAPDFELDREYVDAEVMPGADLPLLTFSLTPKRTRRHTSIHVALLQPRPEGGYYERGAIDPLVLRVAPRGAGLIGQMKWIISSLAFNTKLFAPEPQPIPPAISMMVDAMRGDSPLIDFGQGNQIGEINFQGDIARGDVIKTYNYTGERGAAHIDLDALQDLIDESDRFDPIKELQKLMRRVSVARNVDEDLRDEAALRISQAIKALDAGKPALARERIDQALDILDAMQNGYINAITGKLRKVRKGIIA
ncbi:CHAT domain-containing protein [Candidatus Oscillochloris fontis]|uniref:CHAT domain-containing protein n=1 Tax=Candidatus Oscillochloris fontis TaxID=2496868 RepID=UPI00101DD385|nr:CHAT domain-containing protein [Candidatus Oscillochloris fontis]